MLLTRDYSRILNDLSNYIGIYTIFFFSFPFDRASHQKKKTTSYIDIDRYVVLFMYLRLNGNMVLLLFCFSPPLRPCGHSLWSLADFFTNKTLFYFYY